MAGLDPAISRRVQMRGLARILDASPRRKSGSSFGSQQSEARIQAFAGMTMKAQRTGRVRKAGR